jgi:DNA-binding beta-propeller fold protein YncE
MKSSSIISSTLLLGAMALLVGCAESGETASAQEGAMAMGPAGNAISGEGLPNPAPNETMGFGTLEAGRPAGSSAGADVDPTDGNFVTYERCGSGSAGGPGVNCDSNPSVAPIFKIDRNTGEILQNFGAGVMVTPHGIGVDAEGNVWVTDFAANEAGTKGHQVHKFSPDGELLLSWGTPGQGGTAPGQFYQPTDVIVAPDGSVFVSDGHSGQGQTTQDAVDTARAEGLTSRIMHLTADGQLIEEWGQIGTDHGEFRTPHALQFDSQGRLWVADRGNHRLEIYSQDGTYLESRYMHGRVSGIFITSGDMVYTIDSESGMFNHPNWSNGIRIGPVDQDIITGFIPPHPADDYNGAAGEGIAVDEDGNVLAAEGPASLPFAQGSWTIHRVGM